MFTLIITILILANTYVLAQDSYPKDPSYIETEKSLNNFFIWSFALELIIKLIGLGFRDFTRDSFNMFDALIVLLSFVDTIL